MPSKKKGKDEPSEVIVKEGPADRTIDLTGHPGDRLSPREFAALEELKKHPVAAGHPDKYLMAFLFGRKLDVGRTVELLANNEKWRKENGYDNPAAVFPCAKIYETNYAYLIPDTRDKQGRAIEYLMAGRLRMKDYTLKELLDWAISFWWYMLHREPLEVFRDGVIVVESIHGVSLGGYDMSKGKALMHAFQDNFPMRIKQILVVDPPGIVRALMAIARIFMKKKMIERVRLVKTAELEQYIDKDQLSHEFGGNKVWQLPLRESLFPASAQANASPAPTFEGDL